MGTPARNGRFNGRKSGPGRSAGKSFNSTRSSDRGGKGSEDHQILFQDYFKSVGPRTYAAQVKKATNGNHYIVLTEGKRDEGTDEVRKTRLFIFSEDFPAFFRMVKAAAEFVKAHPVDPEVVEERKAFWSKVAKKGKPAGRSAGAAPAPTAKASPDDGRPRGGPPGSAPGAETGDGADAAPARKEVAPA